MTLKFNDIMKKYYEDEKLGIKNEDAPANSVAGGGVDLSIDKKIDKEKNMPIKMKDGQMKVDLFTASAFVQNLDKLRPDNKKKVEDMINNGTKAQFLKLVNIFFK